VFDSVSPDFPSFRVSLYLTEIFNLPHWIWSFLSISRHGKHVIIIIKQLKSPRKHTFFLWSPYNFPCFRVSVFLRVSPGLSETRIFAKNSLWRHHIAQKMTKTTQLKIKPSTSIHANTRRNHLELALERAARHSELSRKTGQIWMKSSQIYVGNPVFWKNTPWKITSLNPTYCYYYIIFFSINKKVSQILVLILSKKSSSLTLTYW